MRFQIQLAVALAALLSTGLTASSARPEGVVERYFEAYASGDVDAMLELYAADAVFEDVNQRHRVTGHDELRAFLERLVGLHRTMASEPQRTVRGSGMVVVEHEYVGELSGTALAATLGKEACPDITYRLPVTSWFEIRDGLIRRQTDFIDLATLQEIQREALGAPASTL